MTVTINAKAFRSAQMAQAKNDVRDYLEGVCVQTTGRIIGTNNHILYACTPSERSPLGNDTAFDEDKIIRVGGKIPVAAEWLTFDTDKMICTTEKYKPFSFQFVEGNYPDVDRVIPTLPRSEVAHEIGLSAKYLALAGAMAHDVVRVYPGEAKDAVLIESFLPDDGATESIVILPVRL